MTLKVALEYKRSADLSVNGIKIYKNNKYDEHITKIDG